jgi:hypothetical protein
LFPEQLMRLAQTAKLVEPRQFQILPLNADGGGDVVPNQIQPRELLATEFDAGLERILV